MVVIRKYGEVRPDEYNYHICRGQKYSVTHTFNNIKFRNKNAVIIFNERSPNAINAVNRLKENESTDFMRGSSNECNITITEEEFKVLLTNVVIHDKANV